MTDSADLPPNRPLPADIRGFRHYPGWLSLPEQRALLDDLRGVIAAAPLFSPMTPYGKPMSVRMTSAGQFGWVSDRRGYRYSAQHPDGSDWPPIPESVLTIWRAVAGVDRLPECCLINFYSEGARMGLHQDRDEADFGWPVVSVSLGDDGLFRIGNLGRGGNTQSLWLRSGDVMVMGGAADLSRRRPDRLWQLGPVARGRARQPDASCGDLIAPAAPETGGIPPRPRRRRPVRRRASGRNRRRCHRLALQLIETYCRV